MGFILQFHMNVFPAYSDLKVQKIIPYFLQEKISREGERERRGGYLFLFVSLSKCSLCLVIFSNFNFEI